MSNKLEEIADKAGGKGPYKSIKSGGKTYTAFNDTKAFKQLEAGEFKVGDVVKLNYTDSNGTYKNNPITYHNLTSIEKSDGTPTEQPAPQAQSFSSSRDAYWVEKLKYDIEKDKRITRSSSWSRAMEFCELNKEAMLKAGGEQGISLVTIKGIAKEIAEAIYKEE